MPLVAAAVCPHPPLIVPEVAVGAATETDDLRAACDDAVAALLRAAPDLLVVVGGHDRTEMLPPPYTGDFAVWGAAAVAWPPSPEEAATPVRSPALLIGGWLLHRQPVAVEVRLAGVAPGTAPADAAAWGAELGGLAPRVAMLVMGDGSACRGVKSPGYDDPRAEPYDAAVSRALAGADTNALLGLDVDLSVRLKVAGRAPWQVLAGAARAAGTAWRGRVTHDGAPYGVAYLVAGWEPA